MVMEGVLCLRLLVLEVLRAGLLVQEDRSLSHGERKGNEEDEEEEDLPELTDQARHLTLHGTSSLKGGRGKRVQQQEQQVVPVGRQGSWRRKGRHGRMQASEEAGEREREREEGGEHRIPGSGEKCR